MLATRWLLLLGYLRGVGATECLVGCLVQGISPFDDDNLAVWDDRSACDSTTVGCEVTAVTYPGTLFQGALWASASGTDGSSGCTCSICDPYLGGDTTTYMSEDTSVWSRIHCYLAAAEASGYDVSPCVAAIVDTGTLPCVDDEYEAPTVSQFDCEENGLGDLSDSTSVEECNWDGDVRTAQEMFPDASVSLLSAATSAVVNTNSCLVGCVVQGISPFDEDNLAVWENRGTCDPRTIGCEVNTIEYPGNLYQGILWASSSGTDGSSDCTCNFCDPYLGIDPTTYMSEDTSVWSRIHCYLAAVEASGYDVSLCVAAIVDTGTLPCVDDEYEAPTVSQFDCEVNKMSTSVSAEECNWNGDVRMAQDMFPATSVSSSTTETDPVANTNSCLVGCMLQDISPFDADGLAVWDNRGTCDPSTIGCEVSAVRYPGSLFRGAQWASSWGAEGSSDCTCDICDPYPGEDRLTYMSEETLWSRIHCYLVATETSGYDVSPCVAAIVDTGTLPCVDDVYEAPAVGQFDCEANQLGDLSDLASVEECNWAGEYRSTDELYGGTRAPSPLPDPSTAPVSATSDTGVLDSPTPVPSNSLDATPLPDPSTAPATSSTRDDTPQPSTVNTAPTDSTPTAPSLTPPPSPNRPQPGSTSTDSPNLTPSTTSSLGTNGPQPVNSSPASSDTTPTPPTSSLPSTDGPTPPVEAEGGAVSCSFGITCQDDFCCHPDTNTCGRKYTFCQERDFLDGPRCCSGVEGDPDESNVCSEDSICDKPEGTTILESAELWASLASSVLGIFMIVVGWKKCHK